MDLRDSLSAQLPAPREDEPEGLRSEILDELMDHLACAYNRELLRGVPPEEARRRAIERFGDPAAMARRLWFDAMKGRIMAQRVLIGTCLVMMAACLGVVWLVGNQSSRAAKEVAEANHRLAELLGQNQATNKELIKQLQAMAKPTAPSKSAEWIPVSFKLTVEKPDGPPAVGYEATLGRGHGGAAKDDAIHRTSDARGVADFGVVQPGDWEFGIAAGSWTATGGVNAVPGASVVKEIVCPKAEPDQAKVRVRIEWPKSLAKTDVIAVAEFDQREFVSPSGIEWTTVGTAKQIACDTGGHQVGIPRKPELYVEDSSDLKTGSPLGDDMLEQTPVFTHVQIIRWNPESDTVDVDEGPYQLSGLWILRKASGQENEYEVLAISRIGGLSVNVNVGRVESGYVAALPLLGTIALDKQARYNARAGQVSEWVISIPEEVVQAAERKLKNAEGPKISESEVPGT